MTSDHVQASVTGIRWWTTALVLAGMIAFYGGAFAQDAEQEQRNAIFNGHFLEGRSGWSIGGPDDVEIKTRRSMVAHRADAELSLQHDGLAETMTLHSQYPIGVEPGRDYALTLTAAGEGTIAFGVYEYDERGKNTIFPLSQHIALTPEPQTYTFTYAASERAVTIRPRIRIIGEVPPQHEPISQDGPTGTGASAFQVRLLSFKLMLSQAEFLKTTNWPEWAVSGKLSKYRGLSQREIREITRAVAVDGILPPYEPIRPAGRGVFELTTSRFGFTRSVFPSSISVLDTRLLADRILLEIEMGDGESVTALSSKLGFAADEQQVVVRQAVEGKGWTLNLDGTLAYDGLMIFDLNLRADDEVKITKASLAIPISDRIAKYIRYQRDFDDGGHCFGEGPIPLAGETVEVRHTSGRKKIKNDWRPLAPSPARGILWEWHRGVPRYFWIGDEEKGLGWLTESDQGWSNDEGDVTLSLERTATAVVAHLNFITQPLVVDGAWSLRFMIQAMPPKPVRADWFKMRFNRFWNWRPGDEKMVERIEAMIDEDPPAPEEEPPFLVRYAQAATGERQLRPPWEPRKHRQWRDLGYLWWDIWSVGCGSPQVGDPEAMRRYLQAGSYVGYMAMLYFAPTHLSVGDLNGYYYAAKTDAWSKIPSSDGTSLYVKVCPNSFASDYQAYEIGRLIDEYGIEGVYFDNSHPQECSNLAHGCGWVDDDGNTHPTTPYLGVRRLFMMVRGQFVKRGKTPFIMKHAGMFPGTISFIDAQLDGEGDYGYDHTQMFTTAEFRARFIGPNQFGAVEVYLPQFSTGTDKSEVSGAQQVIIGTRRLMALALIHGTPLYCGAINSVPMFKAWTVLDELQGPTVDFIPYWDWPLNETLNARGIYASIYHQPDNSVLVVSNLSDSNTGVVIPRSELDRLIPGLTGAEDHMDGWGVYLDEDSLRISVPNKNFRLISLD